MPAKVLLTALKGPLEGTKYRFDEPMLCMVGRSESCMLRLIDEAGDGVSRHHCLLDIKPPQASICDLGSRNGTYLNREKLTQSQTRELASGNIIQIGHNAFEITLVPARKCCI
ncbi:MAG: FHA domain-containing protein, partial [Lentisphaeria bacterium]|nr:FHA domain-containing protein [Lentisphaeria bacterium]